MNEILQHLPQGLSDRWVGPLSFRLIVQPLVASFLAVRAGAKDARNASPAFLWAAISDSTYRVELLKDGWKDIGKIFVIAFAIDSIYQIIVLKGVYMLQGLGIATLLAVIPYIMIRGPLCRLLRAHAFRGPGIQPAIRK